MVDVMSAAPVPTPVRLVGGPPAESLKVALIRPPWVTLRNSSYLMPTPPIGLAYVAAVLREHGHAIQVIDAPGEAMHQATEFDVKAGRVRRLGLSPAEIVSAIDPDVQLVGIANMFIHEWPTVREIAELVRARFPDVTLIVGGETATSFWPWMFEQTDSIDAAVLGEGEKAVVEVAARVAAGTSLSGTAGLAISDRGENTPGNSGLPVRIRDLSTLPMPAWDLFPLSGYFSHKGATGVDRGRSIPLLATRGCPYKCTFCSSPQMWTTRYIVRDPEDVVDEIEYYVNEYGVSNVDFVDLTPITKRSWTLRLCDELERRNLKVTLQLPIGTRAEALDDEVLTRMAAAGCTNITFAPETGSERMLEVYDKRLDLDHILTSISAARRAGLVTNIHIILGHPAERWIDRWHNLTFMARAAFAGLHIAGTTLFYPYPGSKDFDDLLAAGKLVVSDDYCYDGLCRSGGAGTNWNPNATQKQLHVVQMLGVLGFVALSHALHPSQLVHLVRNIIFGGEEHTWLEQGIRTKRRGPLSKLGVTGPDEADMVPVHQKSRSVSGSSRAAAESSD